MGFGAKARILAHLRFRISCLAEYPPFFLPIPKPKRYKFETQTGLIRAIRILGMKPQSVVEMGISRFKALARKRARALLFKVHPDTGGKADGMKIDLILQALKVIQKADLNQISPKRHWNERIYEVTKGYKNTEDLDFGLNGPA